MTRPAPVGRELVLVGGGHVHVQVLRDFGESPVPGVRLSLIAKEVAPYSGMLPGYVAGHYRHEELHIDLVRLAAFAGARLIHGAAGGVDRARRHVLLADRDTVPFDLLSIDVGVTPDVDAIAGAASHALLVKPISEFAPLWRALKKAALVSTRARAGLVQADRPGARGVRLYGDASDAAGAGR